MAQGSIRKHVAADGTLTWRLRLDIRTKDGTRFQPQRTYPSEADALRARADWAQESLADEAQGFAPDGGDRCARALFRARHGRAIYFILAPRLAAIKIGLSANVPLRMRTLQCDCPDRLRLLALRTAGPRPHRECDLHARFEPLRVVGEWFRAEEPLLSYIATHASDPGTYYQQHMGWTARVYLETHAALFAGEAMPGE